MRHSRKPFLTIRTPGIFLFLALAIGALPGRAESASSRDPRFVIPRLLHFTEDDSFVTIVRLLGPPDRDIISGFSLTVFKLRDGTSIYVKTTPSHNRIYGISRSAPGHLAETLYEPIQTDLMHPLPASAPF